MGLNLHVFVASASDVSKMDTFGTADPYLQLQLGSQQFRTTVLHNTLTPEWNQEFAFAVFSLSHDELNLTLWDEDRTTDDKISTFEIRLRDLPRGGIVDESHPFVPHRGVKKGGRVRLVMQLLPDLWTPWIPSVFTCKKFRVTIHEARDVPKTDVIGWSDPYVKFGLANGPKSTTPVVKNSAAPKWEVSEEWLLADPAEDILQLELWDADAWKSDDLVSKAEVRVQCWAEGRRADWLPLKSTKVGREGGSVRVTGEISAA